MKLLSKITAIMIIIAILLVVGLVAYEIGYSIKQIIN